MHKDIFAIDGQKTQFAIQGFYNTISNASLGSDNSLYIGRNG